VRFIAAVAIVVPLLVAAFVLSGRPRPETTAQIAARQAADSLTQARLAAFGRDPSWGRLLRPDALVVLPDAVGPAEAESAVANLEEDFGHALREGMILPIRVTRVVAGATRRGRLAWAAAEMDYGTNWAEGDNRRYAMRHSAAYLLQDGEWRVMLEHDAYVVDWDELRASAAARRFPPPAPPGPSSGRSSDELERRFKRWLPHLGRTRVDRRALAVGPTPGAPAAGDSAVKAMLGDWERRLGPPRLLPNGLRARAPHNRGVGWVAANLEVSPPEWGGLTLPLRFTGVYRESGEDSWNLVLAHLSIGVADTSEVELARSPLP
jgi:ketosteroid isomerase-like protein